MPNALSSPSGQARPGHLLVVDDDADIVQSARLLLERHGLRVSTAAQPGEIWSVLAAEPVDVILLDLNFSRGAVSGSEGLDCLREIIAHDPEAMVVVVTGHSGVAIAVEAMRAGASDFVMKPWNNARLLATLDAALERRRTATRASSAENRATDRADADTPLLGTSPAMVRLRELMARIAPTDASVLILGEAGTGKSLIARTLHRQSSRRTKPLVFVDLRTITADEAATALFGSDVAPGAVRRAGGGAVVLEEIGALPANLQGRLSDLLARRRVTVTGDDPPQGVDVRVMATSRRSRAELQGRGGLGDELLYTLNTVELAAPPLRDREHDARALADHYLRLFAQRYGRPQRSLSPEAALLIESSPWPGDVRALRQTMERWVLFAQGPRYEVEDLQLIGLGGGPSQGAVEPSLAETERTLVSAALKRNGFNVSRAAKQLGLTRAALYRRMAKHGL